MVTGRRLFVHHAGVRETAPRTAGTAK